MTGSTAEDAGLERVTQRDILSAVNAVRQELSERIDEMTAEMRRNREEHERRHLDETRVAVEDHAAIRQLQAGHTEHGVEIRAVQATVATHATFWAELRGMGTMLKLVFGTSLIGALTGIVALLAVLRDLPR